MIEINDKGDGPWHVYLFWFDGAAVVIEPMHGVDSNKASAKANGLKEIPEGLRDLMLLCLTLPITNQRQYTNTTWRGSQVHLAHYMKNRTREVWEINSDEPYTITELLKP